MKFTSVLAAAAATFVLSGPTQAQQFYGMEYDQGLMQALNSMYGYYGNSCQMGDQNGCYAVSYLNDVSNYMMGASNACLQGNQMGCQAYMQVYQQVSNDYGMFNQQMAGMQQQQPYDPNAFAMQHQQNMQDIQNWGAQNTQDFNNRMAADTAQHERFMQTLRE